MSRINDIECSLQFRMDEATPEVYKICGFGLRKCIHVCKTDVLPYKGCDDKLQHYLALQDQDNNKDMTKVAEE